MSFRRNLVSTQQCAWPQQDAFSMTWVVVHQQLKDYTGLLIFAKVGKTAARLYQ
jgi:hypothetical protein